MTGHDAFVADWQRETAVEWWCEWCGACYHNQAPASWRLSVSDPVKAEFHLDLMSCVCGDCVSREAAKLRQALPQRPGDILFRNRGAR